MEELRLKGLYKLEAAAKRPVEDTSLLVTHSTKMDWPDPGKQEKSLNVALPQDARDPVL